MSKFKKISCKKCGEDFRPQTKFESNKGICPECLKDKDD